MKIKTLVLTLSLLLLAACNADSPSLQPPLVATEFWTARRLKMLKALAGVGGILVSPCRKLSVSNNAISGYTLTTEGDDGGMFHFDAAGHATGHAPTDTAITFADQDIEEAVMIVNAGGVEKVQGWCKDGVRRVF